MIDISKYLLPYSDETNKYSVPVFERHSIFGKRKVWVPCIWREPTSWKSTSRLDFTLFSPNEFATKEAAMEGLDKFLVLNGYYLIREDEVERFTKKLALLI